MGNRQMWHVVGALQARQLGLVSVEQIRAVGLPDVILRDAMRTGRLRRIRRGVFAAVGAPITYEQQVLGAVLAAAGAGIGAGSHATAAYLEGLPLPGHERPNIEVTTRADRQSRTAGVRVHRSVHLSPSDVTQVGGVPLTVATRTIVDLSMRLDRAALGRLADEALRRRLTTLGALQRDALRLHSAPGRSMHRILALVMARTGEDASESLLESFAIAALRRFGVRLPTAQHPVRAPRGRKRRVDLCYEKERAAIEALGFEYHGQRARFDEDAVRNNELVRAGYVPLFVTSAMTDWDIAALVAEAIGDTVPARPERELTFAEWRARRYL
jgi:hypothetical protein